MTFACVLRSGGVYTADWVLRLQRQIHAYLRPDRFVCLTDMDVPCEKIPLAHDWPGWWSKMELHRPGLFDGLVFYLDLDTVVIGDIRELKEYPGRFASLVDFGRDDLPASGALLFRADETTKLYHDFVSEAPDLVGRSDFWWGKRSSPEPLQRLYPGMFGSYKLHGLKAGPRDFRVVCFHGKPKMADLPRGHWARTRWAA